MDKEKEKYDSTLNKNKKKNVGEPKVMEKKR